jgi:hypothetical protein
VISRGLQRFHLPSKPSAESRRSLLPLIPAAPGAAITGPSSVTLELLTHSPVDLVDRAQPPSPATTDPTKGPPSTGPGAARGGPSFIPGEPRGRGNLSSSTETDPSSGRDN